MLSIWTYWNSCHSWSNISCDMFLCMQLLLLDKLLWHVLCISRPLPAISRLSWHQFSIKLWTEISVIIIYRGPRPSLDLHACPPQGRLAKVQWGLQIYKALSPTPQDNEWCSQYRDWYMLKFIQKLSWWRLISFPAQFSLPSKFQRHCTFVNWPKSPVRGC